MTPAEQYAAYRERHTIEPRSTRPGQGIAGGFYTCAHDGIRVFRRIGGWLHSEDEVRAIRTGVPTAWPR